MADPGQTNAVPNPMQLWQQWYETSLGMLSGDTAKGKDTSESFNPYNQWLKMLQDSREQMNMSSMPMLDPGALYKQWLDTACAVSDNANELGADPSGLGAQWLELMEDLRARGATPGSFPADPLTAFRQWYDATSEVWSKVAGDIVGTESFVESTSRFLESYTSFYKTFSHGAEQYYRGLQLPVRSDISRVAALVVNLESKVDHMEDELEDLSDRLQASSRSEAGDGLEERLSRVESKLDELLQALSRSQIGTTAEPTASPARARGRSRNPAGETQ